MASRFRQFAGLLSQGNRGVQRQRRTIVAHWRKNSILIFDVHGVHAPGIIKSWLAPHLEVNLAPDNSQGADNLIRLLSVGRNGHIISQLGYTLVGKKSREQNVRVRQIQLSYLPLIRVAAESENSHRSHHRAAQLLALQVHDDVQRCFLLLGSQSQTVRIASRTAKLKLRLQNVTSLCDVIRAPLYCGQPSSPIRNCSEEEVCLR